MTADQRKSIEIPTRDGSEVVEVFLDELPEDSDDLCEILLSEAASLDLFHQFALEYYKRSQVPAFVNLVRRGIDEGRRKNNQQVNVSLTRLMSTLAAHYIHEGLKLSTIDPTRSSRLLDEAAVCLNEAEARVSANNADFGLRKGLFLLAKNTAEKAGYQFQFLQGKENVPAQLGQACVFYFTENYRAALPMFQALLKACPQFNDLRCAIGYCFLHLGHAELARKAFLRALEVDPQSNNAIVAVGFLNLGKHGDAASLKTGLLQMKSAYEKDKTNPTALLHLANHFFFAKDFSKAKTLASNALMYANNDRSKAEAYFILAKIAHASNSILDSFENYQQSAKHAPSFLPAIFGLGQCFLARNDLVNAATMLEKVLEAEPGCVEAARLLSLIHMTNVARADENDSNRAEAVKKAQSILPVALAAYPNDFVLLQCAAVLFESTNATKSVEYYEALLKANAAASDNFAIINNLAVLQSSLGVNDGGHEIIERAEKLFQSSNSPDAGQIAPFLTFNRARLLESEGRVSEAEAIYRSLLTDPYTSSIGNLRLGSIHFNRGQYAEASDCFKDVMGSDNNNKEAWNSMAATQFKQKAFTPARKAFERVLQEMDKHDPYALVSLGNIHLEIARNDRTKKNSDEYHKRASEFFIKALAVEKGNPYAAQGLGIIFAERGMWSDAKEAFTQVRAALEESKDLRGEKELQDATLNLANSLTELGQPAAAVSLYESIIALKRRQASSEPAGKFVSLLLYMCRARYLWAPISGDWSVLDPAIEAVKEAMSLLPTDLPIKFNKALLLQQRAAVIKNNSDNNIDIEEGKTNVAAAEQIYLELVDAKWEQEKLLQAHIKMCRDTYAGLVKRAEQNEKSLQEQTERLEQLKLHREAQLKEAEELKRQQEASERQKLAEIEAARRELALRMQETEEKIRAASASVSKHREPSEPRARSRRAIKQQAELSGTSADESQTEDDEMDGITRNRRRGPKIDSTLSKEYISSSSDEE